jgi:hypothetical protein
MTKTLKTLLATASLSAVLASAPAHAVNLPCPADTGLGECYAGAVFGSGGTFSDWKIGTVSLGEGLWDLAGFFGARGADGLSLSLVGATTVNAADGVSFSNVAGGDYAVKLSGAFTGPKFFGNQSLAAYAGGFDIKSAVPEPETYALLLAGLMAVGYVARRRKAD